MFLDEINPLGSAILLEHQSNHSREFVLVKGEAIQRSKADRPGEVFVAGRDDAFDAVAERTMLAHGVGVCAWRLGDAEVEFTGDVAPRGESGKERSDGVLKPR